MASMASATSSWRQSRRSAEQRWPAERNAEVMTSSVTCSGSAVPSTIMALMPPVSAISGTIGPSLAASARLIRRPTSVEPVKATPATSGWATSAAPTVPSPGASCAAATGTPALCSRPNARCAISGVCSAGLATTAFPAASAAVTWPRKIDRGKFHGEMQTKTPRPRRTRRVALAGRPRHRLAGEQAARLGRVVAAEIDRLAHLADAIVQRLAALAREQRDQRVAVVLEQIGQPVERRRALLDRLARPFAEAARAGLHDRIDRAERRVDDGADGGAIGRGCRPDARAPLQSWRR